MTSTSATQIIVDKKGSILNLIHHDLSGHLRQTKPDWKVIRECAKRIVKLAEEMVEYSYIAEGKVLPLTSAPISSKEFQTSIENPPTLPPAAAQPAKRSKASKTEIVK